jgi:hypothetical protein
MLMVQAQSDLIAIKTYHDDMKTLPPAFYPAVSCANRIGRLQL